MSKKHRRTLEAVFDDPVRSNIAWRDIEAGAAAGCRTLAVGPHEQWNQTKVDGRKSKVPSKDSLSLPDYRLSSIDSRLPTPEAVLNDLAEAVDYLLKESR